MKKYLPILCCLILVLSMVTPVMAAGGTPKIIDEADLLTSSQEERLSDKAEALADEYRIDVVILTVEDLHGKNINAYADDYFDDRGYGIGGDHSGVIFVLSIGDRETAISTCGKGIDALTDYGQDQLFDEIMDDISSGNYFDAFDTYLDELDHYFQSYRSGDPIDKPISIFSILTKILFALAVGVIVAFLIVTVMGHGMKTARAQKSAQSYVVPGSYDLYVQRDIFLYSQTRKVKKETSSSSSGGSSTHRSSSGRSHGGSSRKF